MNPKKANRKMERKTAVTRSKINFLSVKVLCFSILIMFIVGFSGISFWAGMQIEKRFNRLPFLFSKNQPYQWINHWFDRRIFHSMAETGIKLRDFPLELKMTHDISHGPFLVYDLIQSNLQENLARTFGETIKNYLALASIQTKTKFNPTLSTKLNPLEIKTKVSFERNINNKYRVDPIKFQTPVSVEWNGLNGLTYLPAARNIFKGKFKILPLSITFEDNRFSINKMQTAFNWRLRPSNLSGFSSEFSINRAVFGNSQDLVTLSEVEIQMNLWKQEKLVQASINIQMKEMKRADIIFGPGKLTAHVRNVDALTIMRLREFAGLQEMGILDPQNQGKIFGVLNDLFKQRPELEISEVKITCPDGLLTGFAKLLVDGTQMDLVNNPRSLFDAFQINAFVKAPKNIFEREYQVKDLTNSPSSPVKIQLLVQSLLEQGYLIVEGEDYKTSIKLQNRQIALNGKAFNPFTVGSFLKFTKFE